MEHRYDEPYFQNAVLFLLIIHEFNGLVVYSLLIHRCVPMLFRALNSRGPVHTAVRNRPVYSPRAPEGPGSPPRMLLHCSNWGGYQCQS